MLYILIWVPKVLKKMSATAYTHGNYFPSMASVTNSTLKKPFFNNNNCILCSNLLKPNSSSSKANPFSSFSRLRICHTKIVSLSPKRLNRLLVAVAGLVDGNSDTYPDAESSDSVEGASIDTKLPRRSLLVQFTCGKCGERTERLINRLAYERGLVYVQCAGCEKFHKLADNLGLVIEYALQKEMTSESNADQV